MAALGSEFDYFEEIMELFRQSCWPQRGTTNLALFELLLGLAVASPDKTTGQRVNSILAFYHRLKASGAGSSWEDSLTDLIGTAWSYAEHDPDDVGSPPEGTIEVTLPFAEAIETPEGLVGTPGTGGSLDAGTYDYAVSATTYWGETPPSPVETLVVSATGLVDLAWDASTGATGYRIYRGATGEALQLIGAVTELTFTDDGTATPEGPPTNTNTSASFLAREVRTFIRKVTPAHLALEFGYEAGFIVGISDMGEVL